MEAVDDNHAVTLVRDYLKNYTSREVWSLKVLKRWLN